MVDQFPTLASGYAGGGSTPEWFAQRYGEYIRTATPTQLAELATAIRTQAPQLRLSPQEVEGIMQVISGQAQAAMPPVAPPAMQQQVQPTLAAAAQPQQQALQAPPPGPPGYTPVYPAVRDWLAQTFAPTQEYMGALGMEQSPEIPSRRLNPDRMRGIPMPASARGGQVPQAPQAPPPQMPQMPAPMDVAQAPTAAPLTPQMPQGPMAGAMQPQQPEGAPVYTGAPKDEADIGRRKQRWGEFFNSPEVKAGMMQMGIALLQPTQPGDRPLAQAARALGAGGEAVGRYREGVRAEEAQTAEQATAQQKLDIERERIQSTARNVEKQVMAQMNISAEDRRARLLRDVMASRNAQMESIITWNFDNPDNPREVPLDLFDPLSIRREVEAMLRDSSASPTSPATFSPLFEEYAVNIFKSRPESEWSAVGDTLIQQGVPQEMVERIMMKARGGSTAAPAPTASVTGGGTPPSQQGRA